MTAIKAISSNRRLCSALLLGTALGGLAAPTFAQETAPAETTAPPAETAPQPEAPVTAPPATPPATTAAPPAPTLLTPPAPIGTIRAIAVSGNQRLEAQTVLSYTSLRVGEPYTRERLDEALRDLYATELFADVQIRDDQGALTIQVSENPVVNRIILEGNERLKNDKIAPEIRLAPREIFTRSKVRADVARIIELYRRQGRFAASVEPKIVELDQNRVDLIFEINEGPRSKVRQINILGNEAFSDGDLRSEMATKETSLLSFLGSGNTFDPDRLAFDQQKLRQFYLTEGYADFRVISAVAELTPDKRDFIITYVVEEGERYKFGDVAIESDLRDLSSDRLQPIVSIKSGDWYNAKRIEDTITLLNETAGLLGYAFADVRPQFQRNEDDRTMDVTFQVGDAPRVYVERIDINGNTVTRDKVIRREFRLAEGDPFNSVQVKRSRDRIQSLGFFQENLEIEQTPGSSPDRVVLSVDVEERPTGSLQVSAGFSSLERFLVNLSIEQRNFMGKGQTVQASANYSSYSKSVQLGFTEPYLFDRNISLGGDIYRRDFENFNFVNNDRNTTYKQLQTGGQIRVGVPLTEYMSLLGRYSLNLDDVTLDEDIFFTDPDGPNGPLPPVCDPLRAGRYLCDAIGERTTSSIGYSLVYDTLDNRLRPSTGERLILGQDFAGLGGSVKYLRTRASAVKYFPLGSGGFVFSTSVEGGYIHSFEDSPGPGRDPVRLIDRFFLGESQLRGFDIRGVGPRVIRRGFDGEGNIIPGKDGILADDALGGRAYYTGRAELQLPFGDDLGLRPSIYVDAGALFGLDDPQLVGLSPDDPQAQDRCVDTDGNSTPVPTGGCPTGSVRLAGATPFQEFYVGDTPKPRVSVGFGINWISPFGPFRIDIAKALITAEGDDTKLFTFNVGTAF